MKLYTQSWCGPCKIVKQFIEANDIQVEIVDDMQKFPKQVRSVPVLEVDGRFIVGDSPIIKKLKEKL